MFTPRDKPNLQICRGEQIRMKFENGPYHDQVAFLEEKIGGTHTLTAKGQTGYYEHKPHSKTYRWVKV